MRHAPRFTLLSTSVIVLLLLLLALPAFAGASVSNRAPIDLGARFDETGIGTAEQVAVGDFNRDGKVDIVTASYFDADVAVSMGNGNGTFASPSPIPVAAGNAGVAAGDINNDGLLDVVSANRNGTISVLLGNGDGTFATHVDQTIGSSTNGATITLADVNLDGKLDATASGDAGVTVSMGNGDGTFDSPTAYAHPSSNQVVVTDLNGDSAPDLVSTSFAGNVRIWLNDGNGAFGTPDTIACGSQPYGAAAADFDKDGSVELLVADYTGNEVYLLENDGGGGFSIPMGVASVSKPGYFVVADFNRDGNLDAATGSYDGTIDILRGDGSGNFRAPQLYDSLSRLWVMAGADFNRDGLTDVVASSGDGGFTAMLNKSVVAQGIAYPDALSVDVGMGTRSVSTGDIDGDGHLDAVAFGTGGTAAVLLNDGSGSLSVSGTVDMGSDGTDSALVDLDRDGKLDLVACGNYDGSTGFGVAFGNGDGTFQTAIHPSLPGYAYHLDVADVNLDGYPDIVLGCEGVCNVAVLINDRARGFADAVNYATLSYTEGVCVADFNGDGAPDIAAMNFNDSQISYFMGDGSGAFTRSDQSVGGYNYIDADDADFNGDGRVDLAVGNWYPGDGRIATVFGPDMSGASVTTSTTAVWTVEAVDLSRDGKPDILASDGWMTSGSPAFTILRGDGAGGFDWQRGYGSVEADKGATGDLNGDGRLDLIIPSVYGNDVSVYMAALPEGPMEIAGGAVSTTTPWVTLDMSSTTASEYRARNVGGDWSAWRPYATTVPWRLTSGAGTKSADVQFRDADGNTSDAVRDDIDYAPETTPPTSSQVGADGAWHDIDVTVKFSGVDEPGGSGVDYLQYSTDAGSSWVTGDKLVLPADSSGIDDGWYTILYRAVDNAGNIQDPPNSCEVGIDTQPPSTTDDAPSGWVTSDTVVNLYHSDSGCGWRYTQYRVDGGAWKRGTSVTIPAPGSHANDGVHRVDYRSVDLLYHVEGYKTAYVRVGDPAVHVSPAGSDTTGKGTAAKPFKTIGHAMDVLGGGGGETIFVHAGTYHEDVAMKGGVTLAGDGPTTTTVVGSGSAPVVSAYSLGSAITVRGLTITGGDATYGGGIALDSVAGTSTIAGCVIDGNHAAAYGGGVYGAGCDLQIDDSIVSDNASLYDGAGIYVAYASALGVSDTTITANSIGFNGYGAGLCVWNSGDVSVARCAFTGNTADNYGYFGAALVTNSGTCEMHDCLIAGNSAVSGPALGFGTTSSSTHVSGCTIVNNFAYGYQAVYSWFAGAQISDSIVRNPVGELGGATSAQYSDVEGGAGGTGNFDTAPSFVDSAAGDYRLQDGSPCIGAGDPGFGSGYDLDQVPRPQADNNGGDAALDVGCYERPSFVIQAGAASTWLTSVELDSMFPQATEMRFCNAGQAWSDWAPYEGTRTDWALDIGHHGGAGTKTVHAEYRYLGIDGDTRVLSQTDSIDYAPYVGDSTPPVTNVSGNDGGWHGDDVVLSFVANDAESGVRTTWVEIGGGGYAPLTGSDLTIPAVGDGSNDGVHHISFFSDDWAGNSEAPTTVDVKIDATAPSTTLDGLNHGWLNASGSLQLTPTDAGSGPATTTWRLDGAGSWHHGLSPDTSALAEGDHFIEFSTVDGAGNVEDLQSVDFGIDRTGPTLGDDADGVWHNDWASATVDGSDAFSGFDSGSLEYRVDGDSWHPFTGTIRLGVWKRAGGNGDHVVDYRATDIAGNMATGSCHLMLDNHPPRTTMDPTVPTSFPATITLSASDGDGSGVASTYYSTDGTTWTEGTTFDLDAPGWVYFYSVDALGRAENMRIVKVEQPDLLLDTSNGSYVWNTMSGNAPQLIVVTSARVMKIWDYHYNYGSGVDPTDQTISLVRVADGKVFGPWAVTGRSGGWGPNEIWEVTPGAPGGVTLTAGVYTVVDTGQDTWSFNYDSVSQYFTWIWGK